MSEANPPGGYVGEDNTMLNPNCKKPGLEKETYFMITKGTRCVLIFF